MLVAGGVWAFGPPKMGPMDEHGHILVVDDDPDILDLLARTLEVEGFSVARASDATEALDEFQRQPADLVILDVMLPEVDGLELCRRIRAISEVTILMLSARSEELDQLVGFALGADDYLAKPFRPRELAARVKARMRRIRGEEHSAEVKRRLGTGDLSLDSRAHEVELAGKPLSLTPTEFSVLELLARHPGEPVPAKRIFEEVWKLPYDASAANTVTVHIRHIRQKMAEVLGAEAHIVTVWGVGYKLIGER